MHLLGRKLIIKFYDKPETNNLKFLLKDKDASIKYNGFSNCFDYNFFVAKDFVGYWKKITFEFLNQGDISFKLNSCLYNVIDNIKPDIKDINILHDQRPGFGLNIVPERLKAPILYKAEFEDFNKIPFSLVTIDRTMGGEAFYSSKSVLIFFDYLIRKLKFPSYYIEGNDYAKEHPFEYLDQFITDVKKLYKNNLEDYFYL